MTNPTYVCCMEAESAAENDKWKRVGWEGEKPVSVLQFIWSFISERERDRWRNMEMEGKAAEQKESRDFQRKKKQKKRKNICLKSISISSSSPSQGTRMPLLSISHMLSGFISP